MRLLVLGAGGFIGSNLVEHLIAEGKHDVVGVDVTDEKLDGIAGGNFRFIQADISEDRAGAKRLVAESDVVVDLIAYANPSIYVEAPLDVVRLNFFENMHILEACLEHGKRLFQYSTSEIYGKRSSNGHFHEDESDLIMGPVVKQRWIYASSKQLLERIIHAHGLRGDLEYTIVRPFNFIGPRFDYLVPAATTGGPRVFAHFMSALLTGGPMYLVDGGHRKRCFTHIEDANRAFSLLLEHPGAINQAFNVGNPGSDTTIRGLADRMYRIYEELTGIRPQNELVEISGEEFYGVGYEDMDRVPPDISKIGALGWSPRSDLDATLTDAMRSHLDPRVLTTLFG